MRIESHNATSKEHSTLETMKDAFTSISADPSVLEGAHPVYAVVEKEATEPLCSNHDNKRDETGWTKQSKGAAVFCGLSFLIIGGPFLAILAAIGGAHTARNNKGAAGDVSRSLGDIALAAEGKAKDSDILGKSKIAAKSIFDEVRNVFSHDRK